MLLVAIQWGHVVWEDQFIISHCTFDMVFLAPQGQGEKRPSASRG
jgi:hypothetical protein